MQPWMQFPPEFDLERCSGVKYLVVGGWSKQQGAMWQGFGGEKQYQPRLPQITWYYQGAKLKATVEGEGASPHSKQKTSL